MYAEQQTVNAVSIYQVSFWFATIPVTKTCKKLSAQLFAREKAGDKAGTVSVQATWKDSECQRLGHNF